MSNTKTATRFSVGVMTRIAILSAIASILFLIGQSYNPFIYFRF